MQFSITIEVDAPPEVVFAVLSEVERWPEWTPTVTRVERLADAGAPLALGGRLRIVQPKVPPAEWTVTALEPGRGFRLVSRSPGATVEANLLGTADGSGTPLPGDALRDVCRLLGAGHRLDDAEPQQAVPCTGSGRAQTPK